MKIRILVLTIPFSLLLGCNNTGKQSDLVNMKDPVSESLLKNAPDLNSDTYSLDTAQLAAMREPEQLVTKHVLTKDDLYRDYDGGRDLSKFFEIELIDRDIYLANRNTSINYLLYDSLSFQKKDGVIKLPLDKGELDLIDNLADGDKHKEYKYMGQIKALDMYLVQGTFWEDWSYILYDKKRGREVQSFIGIPYLSADMQYIMCLEIDSFEGVANISLYAISENEKTKQKYIDPVVEMYVKSWIPYTLKDEIYWGSDGSLYAPVLYTPNFIDAEGNYFGLDQYIKIRPIAA